MTRETWTDARIDDFRENVNQRFDQVDKRLDRIEETMRHGFFVLIGINATSTLTLVGLMVGLKVF